MWRLASPDGGESDLEFFLKGKGFVGKEVGKIVGKTGAMSEDALIIEGWLEWMALKKGTKASERLVSVKECFRVLVVSSLTELVANTGSRWTVL